MLTSYVSGQCTVYAGLHGYVGDSVSTAAVFTSWKPLERQKDRLSDAVHLQVHKFKFSW